jgi:hypothetical protein
MPSSTWGAGAAACCTGAAGFAGAAGLETAAFAAAFFLPRPSKILPSSVMIAISSTRIKNTSTIPVKVTTTSKPKSMVFPPVSQRFAAGAGTCRENTIWE